MKKLLTTLLCAMLTLCAFAQSESESNENVNTHLKFKGIPIDGTPSEFARQLSRNGFVYEETIGGAQRYKGSFAGYDNCDVGVKSANSLVYEVIVIFPKEYTWNHLYGTYSSLKKMLTSKYGEPLKSKEEFENTPSYRNIADDNDKYKEVKDNHCNYYAIFFSTPDESGPGSIQIEIKSSGRVGIHYEDYENASKMMDSAMNDL